MKNLQKLIIPGILLVILISAAAVQPQLSMDEQSAIIEAVVQTMNPENMKATIIAEVEALDDAYYAAFPSFKELLDRYGDKAGDKLYSRRDLFHRCRQQYAREIGIEVYDVTDERQCGSRRY